MIATLSQRISKPPKSPRAGAKLSWKSKDRKPPRPDGLNVCFLAVDALARQLAVARRQGALARGGVLSRASA